MERSDVLHMFAAHGLARVSHDLEPLLLDSIRITSHPADAAQIAAGASKLGGIPDLPPGVPWPAWKNVPLAFIAQIRLADVVGFAAARALLPSGMLWFFYDAQQQVFGADPADRGGWQVVYDQRDPASFQPAPFPAGLPAAGRYEACVLSFANELSLPQQPDVFLPNMDWTPAERTAYEDLLAAYPTPADHVAIHHRLLGHADAIQDDMHLQCALRAQGITDMNDPRGAAATNTALRWQLLLQIDSDEHAGMKWATDGMLYYWIDRDALHNRHFDDTWLVLQAE